MRDTVHQVAVKRVQDLLRAVRAEHGPALIVRNDARQDAADQVFRVADGVAHRHKHDGLAAEAVHVHGHVRRHNDALAGADLLLGERVAHAGRAVRLHLDRDVHALGRLTELLGGHVGVGDAGGAGRHSQDARVFPLRLRGVQRFLALLRLADDVTKPLRRDGALQLLAEGILHEQGGQPAERLQMRAGPLFRRGGDEENEVHGLAVHGMEVHAFRHRHGGERRHTHALAARVGDGYAAPHAGGALRLALLDVAQEFHGILQHAAALKRVRQKHQRLRLVGGVLVEQDKFLAKHVQQAHGSLFLLFCGPKAVRFSGLPISPCGNGCMS